MVVYGGRGGRYKGYHNDIYFTDAATPSWAKSPGTGQVPAARSNHSASPMGSNANKVLFFGGSTDDKTTTNELYILEV